MAISPIQPNKVLSTSKKNAVDNKAAKEVFEFYAMNRRPMSDLYRFRENYDLHVGRWTTLEEYANTGHHTVVGDEVVEVGKVDILHYPIINRVTASMVSDLIKMGLSYNIKDLSASANSMRKEKRLEIIKQAINEKYIAPIQQAIASQVMQEQGVDTTAPMDPQVMQQIQETINQRVKEQTPESIQNAMSKVRTPDEILCGKIMSMQVNKHNLKKKFIDGGTYAICTGEEYYRVSIIDNRLHFEDLKPEWVVWGGSDGVENAEDGLFAVVHRPLTAEDAIQRYGTLLSKKSAQDLFKLFSYGQMTAEGGKNGKGMIEFSASDLLPLYKSNPNLGNIDYRTREGQQQMWAMRSAIMLGYRHGMVIEETYVTWRWTRVMKMVERFEEGIKKVLFFDEHYEQQPGDISVNEFVAEEVWEGVALGTPENRTYVYMRPVPYQYPDLSSPRSPKLTIYGGHYNTVKGSVRGTTQIDLAKPFQFDHNYLRAKIKKDQASDFGRVLSMTMNAKPTSWSWQQWFDTLRNDKLIMADTSYEGFNPNDVMAFRSIDLGMQNEILSNLRQLSESENQIYVAMSRNPAMMGNIGQYATDQNIQQTMSGSESLTMPFYNRHQEIINNVMTAILEASIVAFKDNTSEQEMIFDEFTKEYFKYREPFHNSSMGIFVINDMEERKRVEAMRARTIEILQNGGRVTAVAKLMGASTMDEIIEIFEAEQRQIEESKKADQQFQQQMQQQQMQAQQQAMQMKYEFEKAKYEFEGNIKLQTSTIMATQLMKANDIDENNLNDANERQEKELDLKRQIEEAKLEIEREKVNVQKLKSTYGNK
jgi:hypothetical protein